MPRSTITASKKRRTSKRLSAMGSKTTTSDQSSSSSSSSCASSSSAESKPIRRKTRSSTAAAAVDPSSWVPSSFSKSKSDGPYRRLRTRKTTTNDEHDDWFSKAPVKPRTKRALATADSNQRKKTRLVVHTKDEKALSSSSSDEENDPTQHRKPATQVTPSPANTNSQFFQSPPVRRRRLPGKSTYSSDNLPPGVLDLYPPKGKTPKTFGQNDCTSDSLTASFIQSYGQDYWTYLKATEEPTIADPFPPSVQGSPSSSSSSSEDDRSTGTPVQKRDYVYVDGCTLETHIPTESNEFLAYQPELSPKMRAILVDWIIELSEHFHFGSASLHLAITLVDKVMACGPLTKIYDEPEDFSDEESKTNCFFISRDRFQLLGAACTWLACKMEELSPPSVSEIAYVSDNIYSTEQIKRMERRICNALSFALHPPTPYLYTAEFIRASYEQDCLPQTSPVFYQMTMYLLELCRLPYLPVTQKPSLLAAAAVYMARVTLGIQSTDRSLDEQGRWSPTLQHYTGYSKEDLRSTCLLLQNYHQAAEESSLKSVFAKYRTKKYLRVALKTVPRVQDLGF